MFHPSVPSYTAVSNQGADSRRTGPFRETKRRNNNNFRPIPLRLPFLFSFMTLSAIYIVLIELLLHYAETSITSPDAGRMFKRQSGEMSTSTSFVTITSTVYMTTVHTEYSYTTSYPTTYTGTDVTTVTLQPSSIYSAVATTPTSSPASTKSSNLSIVTSDGSSYYVTTISRTEIVTVPLTKTTIVGQTFLILKPPQTMSKTTKSIGTTKTLYTIPSSSLLVLTPKSSSISSSSMHMKTSTSALPSSIILTITSKSPTPETGSSSSASTGRPVSQIPDDSILILTSSSSQHTPYSTIVATSSLAPNTVLTLTSNPPQPSSPSSTLAPETVLALTSDETTSVPQSNVGTASTMHSTIAPTSQDISPLIADSTNGGSFNQPFGTTLMPTIATGFLTTTVATSTSSPKLNFVLSTSERLVQGTFTTGYYVAALYVPALMAIVIKGLWEVVYASTRLMQPFERLATPQGASGRYSLSAQYLSSSLSLDVIRAMSHGNPIPFLAELSYVLVQIGTPLATIATTIKSRDMCDIGGTQMHCDPVWVVDVTLLRAVEGILGFCIFCIVIILLMRARHRSGVNSDPSSLGSIASMANDENLLRRMQAYAIDTEPILLEQMLRKQHFRLGQNHARDGRPLYGIIPIQDTAAVPSKLELMQAYPGYQYHTVADPRLSFTDQQTLTPAPRAPLFSPTGQAFLLDILGLMIPVTLLTIIVSYWFDGNDDVWNRFLGSDSVWPKLLLVGLATLSSILLTNIERIVRITEPFRRLNTNTQQSGRKAKTLAPPATTLFMSRSGTAYSTLMQCFVLLLRYEFRGGRMGFQSLVAIAVVLSDINIVAVSGVAYTQATTQISYQVSMLTSMGLTGFVIIVWLIIILWWRRHRAVQVLRASNGAGNIAGSIRYVSCGGKEVVDEVARVYEMWQSHGSRGRQAREWRDYQAVFGQHICSDGKERWCIAFQKMPQEYDEIQNMAEAEARSRYY